MQSWMPNEASEWGSEQICACVFVCVCVCVSELVNKWVSEWLIEQMYGMGVFNCDEISRGN